VTCALLLGSALSAPFWTASLAHAQAAPVPGISVVGQGIVLAQPDTARITLGTEVTDVSLANAQTQAAQRMDAIVARLRGQGIADSDIRTVSFSVNPQNDQNGALRGYQVQNLVEVKTTNVAGLGALLDDVVNAGASRIYGIRFEASNMEALKSQARDQAMQNAHTKAEQLAGDAGVSLGRVVTIEESDTGGATPVRQQAPTAALAAAPATPVQPGELSVSTTVRVIWAIQ
jgi:uncharacterized protein YggE